MKRTALRRHTRLRPRSRKPRKSTVKDKAYREWILTQSSIVGFWQGVDLLPMSYIEQSCISFKIEGHHVGRPRNDRRMVPLYYWLHRETPISVHGGGGDRAFQSRFSVDFEEHIKLLNERYDQERGAA